MAQLRTGSSGMAGAQRSGSLNAALETEVDTVFGSVSTRKSCDVGRAATPSGGAGGGGGPMSTPRPPSPPPKPSLLPPIEEQMALRFSRISAWVSIDYDQPGVLTQVRRAVSPAQREAAAAASRRQILHGVSGEIVPGGILALMGPSGSGKTSLLSVISGRAPRAVTTAGRVTTNGEPFTKAQKRRVGFVLQDDLLYESLTVRETLGYAAALRLPRSMSAAQRAARVDAVLAALGLTKCADTIIGGFFRRGISGGERKRCSIACELLINPSILMLDEPTSGLDSTTALHLITTLKQLALAGRSLCTTIHQPSSRLFEQLDRVMLLAEGHVAYYGAAGRVTAWFSALGFECRYGISTADFLLDLAQGEVAGRCDAGVLLLEEEGEEEKGGKQSGGAAAAHDGSRGANGVIAAVNGGSTAAAAGLNGAGAGGGKESRCLEGAPAITALWASYDAWRRRSSGRRSSSAGAGAGGGSNRDGFLRDEQLADLALVLQPPLTKRQRAAAAFASASGKDPVAAAAAAADQLPPRSSGAGGSFIGRGLQSVGSFLRSGGLEQQPSRAGGARSSHGGAGGGAGGLSSDDELGSDTFSAGDSDDEDGSGDIEAGGGGGARKRPPGSTPIGRGLSRVWSRPRLTAGTGDGGKAPGPVARAVRALGAADRGGASYGTQWRILLERCIRVKRFESLSGQRFWQSFAVAAVTGLFWWQRGRGNTLLAASDVVGLLFFEMLFPAFTALFTALFTFPNDYRMLLKERASGMYRVSAFYLASAASDLPMDCALPVLFVVVIYFMGGLRLTAAAFFSNVAALVLLVLTAQSLGLFLGAVFMNPKTAQTVASIVMLGFMLVGGYYVRGIPSWISWLRYISFVYWGFNLLLKIEFSGAQYVACGTGSGLGGGIEGGAAAAAAPCEPVPDLQQALQLPVSPNDSPALDIGVLLAMLVAIRALVYWTLRHKTKAA